MAATPREASSLTHSTAALRERAAKAGLSNEEVQAILDNNVTSILILEAHTLVVANIKSEVGCKDDVTTHCVLPSAERDRRIQDQQKRLTLDSDSKGMKKSLSRLTI